MKLSLPLGLSLSMFALVIVAHFAVEAREMELKARLDACHANPYTCNAPSVSLAMLR